MGGRAYMRDMEMPEERMSEQDDVKDAGILTFIHERCVRTDAFSESFGCLVPELSVG